MSRIGRAALVLGLAFAGCREPENAAPPPASLSVRRPEGGMQVFPGDETPAASFAFAGAPGNVRVTMEVDRAVDPGTPSEPTINDVLFRARGDGRIVVGFVPPEPGHPQGRVTIRCLSGGEESEAGFEPEIWLGHPSAIVTTEPPPADASERVAEGREVVLARYVARNLPRDIRLTLKAIFSKEPIAPRVKAGPKPPR